MTFGAKRPLWHSTNIAGIVHSGNMISVCRKMRSLVAQLAGKVLPSACVFCGNKNECQRICTKCREQLPWNDIFCERCGQPLPASQPDGVVCAHCQFSPPSFTSARAPLIYSFPVDHALKSLKFKRHLWYAPALGELLLPVMQENYQHCDALLPVPLHRWRQAFRGFNQVMEICLLLRRATGLRILTDVQRIKATPPQTGLTAAERKKNLRGAFAVPPQLQCRYPLVIDDVITTGATISRFADVLLRAGAEDVSALAVARVDQLAATGVNV
jgi:ComF family protein